MTQSLGGLDSSGAKVEAEDDAAFERWVLGQCFTAFAFPIHWRAAIRLSNRWKLRKMLRICHRLNALYRGMHHYKRYRTLHRCLWA